MKTTIISIPGAGWFIVNRDRTIRQLSSKCYKTAAAAKAARTRGVLLSLRPLT